MGIPHGRRPFQGGDCRRAAGSRRSTPRIFPTCIRRSTITRRWSKADRCYFCYDAPCMKACPTSIDIPLFIRQISTGNPIGSAKTIFDQNILGGMCARVCPTETLCEEVCVREMAEGKPVQIGRLQRYATDVAMAQDKQFYARAAPTGKTDRRRRRRAGGPRRRAPAGAPWPRGDDPRGAAEGRRPQRIRHRRLQEHRRFRAGRGRLRHRDRRHRHRERQGARPRLCSWPT